MKYSLELFSSFAFRFISACVTQLNNIGNRMSYLFNHSQCYRTINTCDFIIVTICVSTQILLLKSVLLKLQCY